uniref:Uncharacterized protein n=1 Tax=Noccaea caerulescens TaxID=107243 RepID=A0A1J3K738_NOCCA
MNSSSDFTITTPFSPSAAEQRLLPRGRQVLEKLNLMDAQEVEAANNEFLAIRDDIEFGTTMRDRDELDNAEDRDDDDDDDDDDDPSVEKRR